MGCRETSCNTEEWERWDEDLVKDFGRWLGRLAKTLGLLFLGILAALVIRWIWKNPRGRLNVRNERSTAKASAFPVLLQRDCGELQSCKTQDRPARRPVRACPAATFSMSYTDMSRLTRLTSTPITLNAQSWHFFS